MKRTLLSLDFDDFSKQEWEFRLKQALLSPNATTVYTLNAEIADRCARDPDFCALIARGNLIAPDGEGILLGGKLAGNSFRHGKRAGVELGLTVAGLCAKEGCSLYLFGGAEGVVEEAARRLCERFPSLIIAGCSAGFGFDPGAVAEKIRASGAGAVFVCLGSPTQERWIDQWKDESRASLLLGLGGSLDVYAGRVERAPKAWIDAKLEWLWRLLLQPKRFFRMTAIPHYLALCLREGQRKKKAGGR